MNLSSGPSQCPFLLLKGNYFMFEILHLVASDQFQEAESLHSTSVCVQIKQMKYDVLLYISYRCAKAFQSLH